MPDMTAASNTNSVSKNQSPTTKLSHNAPNPSQSPSLPGHRQSVGPSRSSRGKSKEDRSGSSPKAMLKADHFSPMAQERRR